LQDKTQTPKFYLHGQSSYSSLTGLSTAIWLSFLQLASGSLVEFRLLNSCAILLDTWDSAGL